MQMRFKHMRWTYRVHGRLDLIGNDELDSGGLERVLWVEPDHEMKDLILEKKGSEDGQ